MIFIRRLPCKARQEVLTTVLWKKSVQPFPCSSDHLSLLSDEKESWKNFKNLIKSNFHTTSVHRDIEDGLKNFGAPLALLGMTGPGIGLGVLGYGMAMAVARNPSASNEIFIKSLLALASCELLGLLTAVTSVVFKFV